VDDSLGRDDEEGLLPSRADPPSDYPEELIEEAQTRARMSTLQRDELLTQSKVLEKETSPLAKEAKQSPTKQNIVRIYNRIVVRREQAELLISRSAGVWANHRYLALVEVQSLITARSCKRYRTLT
jgi:alpha-galactosidase/6-phospho-beta-glucosidase family protein